MVCCESVLEGVADIVVGDMASLKSQDIPFCKYIGSGRFSVP